MPQWSNYRQSPLQAYGSTTAGNAPNIDWLSDNLRLAFITATYSPNLDTDVFFSTPVANEAAGTGYTAGGFAVATPTLSTTIANSFGTAWAAATAYGGDTTTALVRPTTGNGFVYRSAIAGTSAGAEPTWPTTTGVSVVDSGVTWSCFARNILQFGAANLSASGVTLTWRYTVLYNRTPASDATRPLIALYDWGSTQVITAGNIAMTFGPNGLLYIGT